MEPRGGVPSSPLLGKSPSQRSAPPITHTSPTKPKPPVPVKTDLVKSLAGKSLKPVPHAVLPYSQHVQNKPSVTTPKPASPATPNKPIPPPKPKKGTEMQVKSSKPIVMETPDPRSAQMSSTTATEVWPLESARVTSDPVDHVNALDREKVGVVSLPPCDEPSHFTFVGESPLASPSTPASTPTIVKGSGHSPLIPRRVDTPTGPITASHHCQDPPTPPVHQVPAVTIPPTPPVHQVPAVSVPPTPPVLQVSAVTVPAQLDTTPPIQIATSGIERGQLEASDHAHLMTTPPIHNQTSSSPKLGRRANKEATPSTQTTGSPKFGRRANKEATPPAPSVSSPTPCHQIHLDSAHRGDVTPTERDGSPVSLPVCTNQEATSLSQAATCHARQEITLPVLIATSSVLGGSGHPEATPLFQIAVSPKLGCPASVQGSNSASSTMESFTPSKAVPTTRVATSPTRAATPPAQIATPPSQTATLSECSLHTPPPTVSIPPAADGSRVSMVMSKSNQDTNDLPPTHPSSLTLWTVPPPSCIPLPPPPSYSPPPPPISPISPLGESIAAVFSFPTHDDGLFLDPASKAKAHEGLKATPSDQQREDAKGAPPLLDDDIYSVVGQVATVVTTTDGILEAEYSLLNEPSDGEGVGQDGCGQSVQLVASHASSEAKPVRPQLPVPSPPSSSPSFPSSSCCSTAGSLPEAKVGVATVDPLHEEQPGYFVVGPDTVRNSLLLNGHKRRESGGDDDMYSHLAEPPRAPVTTTSKGTKTEGGMKEAGEGGDVDTYSHLGNSLVPSKGKVAVSKGMSPDVDEDTYSCVADPPCPPCSVTNTQSSQRSSSSTSGNSHTPTTNSSSDGHPPSSLPSGDGDKVAPTRPLAKAHIYDTPDVSKPGVHGGGESLESSNDTSPKSSAVESKVSTGTPSPSGKKRSLTIVPRRDPPPVPIPNPPLDVLTTPTPPSPSSSDSSRKKDVTKATMTDQEGKNSAKGSKGFFSFMKLGRSSGSSDKSTPPVEKGAIPAPLKTSTLPSVGRHGNTKGLRLENLTGLADDPTGTHSVAGKTPVERSFSSNMPVNNGKEKVEVIGSHSYSVVDIDTINARRDQLLPPVVQMSDPMGDKSKWGSNDELSSSNVGGGKKKGKEEGSDTREDVDHLYDSVEMSAAAGRRGDEKKPVPIKNSFKERSETQNRTKSVRVTSSTPPTPRGTKGEGRSHMYETLDDSSLPQRLTGKPRSSSFDFVESTNPIVSPATTLTDQSRGVEHTILVSDPKSLYAQVDKSKKTKEGPEEGTDVLPSISKPDVVVTGDKPGDEEGPPIVPMRTDDPVASPVQFPSSPSSSAPVPERMATFSIPGEEGADGVGGEPQSSAQDQADHVSVSGRGKPQEDGQDESTGGMCSLPQSIQHMLSLQGTVYAMISKEKGSGPPLPPPLQASSDVPLPPTNLPVSSVTPVVPATPPPRPLPFISTRGTSGSSLGSTYDVCGGEGGGASPLLPPRSPLPLPNLSHTHPQPPTKPLPAIPTSAHGRMEPTYDVPDVDKRIGAIATGDRPQAPPIPKVPSVMSTRPLPPIIPSSSEGPSLGIMDPEYATPGMNYVVSVPTTDGNVMGHFHMKEGVADPQVGVVGTSPLPPPSTVQSHIESGTKTMMEQKGVATTPLASLTQAKDISTTSNSRKSKKPKKHSYEVVKTIDEVPLPELSESGVSPPGTIPSSKQSLTLPRKVVDFPSESGVRSKPKVRAKSLKPKNRPPPEPPKMSGQGVLLDDSSSRSSEMASGTGEEASLTKSQSGTLCDDSGSSDSEYSSGEEEEEGEEVFFASNEEVLSEAKGGKYGKTFYIAQEMLTTERTYVKGLRLLHEDFRDWINSNRDNDKPVIPDEVLKQILGNVGSLVGLNSGLLNELEARMANWDEDPRVGDIMTSKAPYLKLYTEYISKFDKALKALEEARKKYPQFAELLRDFEAEPKCASLPLASYMLEVVQRIPRYKLLLADYVKHLPLDSPDRKSSETALEIISQVALHVNDTMKRMDNFKKVIEVCKKLSGDTGDSLITPYRKLIKEGELLKSCRKEKQTKMFFLFNDLLLYCISHPPGLTYKVVMRIPLDGMRVQPLNDPDMKHGFQIISTCKSFRLEASSAEECQQWIDAIKNAIRENSEMEANKAIVRAKSISKSGRAGSELGHLAPAWLPDNCVSMCQSCSVHFTLTKRRHHCRACGMIFCAECAGYVANLKYLDNKPGRVCHICCIKLKGDASSEDRSPQKRKKKLSEKQTSMPAVLTEVKARDRSAQMSGYLFTHKSKTTRWKKRWYVVYNLVLYEFVRHEDVVAKRTITLPSYKVIAPSEGKEDTLIFSVKHPGTTEYYFKAENVELLKKWCEVLNKAVHGDCGGSIPEVPSDQ